MGEKVILCFGDSLTWGFNPENGERYPREKRWTFLLERELGEGWRIIEEGLNGRTTGFDDPIEGDKNGRRHLPVLLESHRPLDLVVIMLGTNDLKGRFGLSAAGIAQSVGVLVDIVLKSGASSKVLLVAPPPLAELTRLATVWGFEGAVEKSRRLAEYYEVTARWHRCHFFDAGKVVRTSNLDGVHWEEEENQKFAQALAQEIRRIFS
ncbi:MAG: SGNH/GDSL hydrolase family protein [Candidatus Atribacteria bacterium]|nr:SGNH/GDSL hydrolase family protein [Candidatus Atribacteria bacterium]